MKKILKYAFMNALGTAAYIVAIGLFFYLAEHGIFGEQETILIPIAMLMLFVFSAALTGSLMLGRPIMWYIDGKKREALTLFGWTLAIFMVITLIAFLALISIAR